MLLFSGKGVITLTTWTAKSLITSIGQTFALHNGRYSLINGGKKYRTHITPQSSLIKFVCVLLIISVSMYVIPVHTIFNRYEW